MINWTSDSTELLINPRMPVEEKGRLKGILNYSKDYPSHIWLCSSGSTAHASDALKLVALSKFAILLSAESVNYHLQSDKKDVWINPLPHFHIGGLAISARALLSGARVVNYNEKWNAVDFYKLLCSEKATLTAIVPSQLYDIVNAKLASPKSLRAVIVGGGHLSEELYFEGTKLGWNLLTTYGMTETCSQIATSPVIKAGDGYPRMEILHHMRVRLSTNGHLEVQSPSLLTTYAYLTEKGFRFVDPKVNGALLTEDIGEIDGIFLKILGRAGDFVKIGGESVGLQRLEKILEKNMLKKGLQSDYALVAVPDPRLGHVVNLVVTENHSSLNDVVDGYHAEVLPFEKIRKIHCVEKIPRTALGKLQRNLLLQMLVG